MNVRALRAVVVVAAVYGHFLIFAQFAWVELLRLAGAGLVFERVVLGVMAGAGIAGCLGAGWLGVGVRGARVGLGVAGLSAAVAPMAVGMPWALGVALATGAALGVATVAVAACLPRWCGLVAVGVGTGLGYALCNLPWVFGQTPAVQAWVGAAMAVVGALAVPEVGEERRTEVGAVVPWPVAVAVFAALVWMDSAAFFVIQHVAEMKAGTWGGGMLWRNALVHAGVAALAGWALWRGGARWVPVAGWVLLAVASLAVNHAEGRHLAGWFYPAGVSLYCAAFVAWPGWFSGAVGTRAVAKRAAVLFAVAGWFASANGIGMAETLRRVPDGFVLGAGLLVVGGMCFSPLGRRRSGLVVAGVLAAVGLGSWVSRRGGEPADPVARGRQVYLAEGCIHCHSQYLRPGSLDESLWGGAGDLAAVRKGVPVLIGNRRQGPDLATVGARRSPAWLREHFIDPQLLAPGTTMPSYARLFEDRRGDDLIAYLRASALSWTGGVVARSDQWEPAAAGKFADAARGKELFGKWCAACHGAEGRGDGVLANRFAKKPANLVIGPFLYTSDSESIELKISRVIRFGLPGTDMPGHEVLTDSQVMDLGAYVLELRGR